MKTIKELLAQKGTTVHTVGPDASVYEAISLMAERDVGALVVVDGESLVGIVTERDYARKITLEGRVSRDTRVAEIMTRRVAGARPDQTVEECMALMTDKRVRHLPVLEDERLVGLISIGDLVKAIIAEQQFLIEQLEHYISG